MTAPLISTTDRPFQLLPPLDEQQRHLLRQSIEKNGVLEPVVFDEDGEILDGHHRVEIAEELGIEYPRRVIDDLDRPGKHMYALTVNVARRQLDHSARGSLIAQMRLRGMSIREIAKATGASVGKVHKDLQVFTDEHLPERIEGADGKFYAATRPPVEPTPTPGPVEAEAAPPADPGTTPAPTLVPQPIAAHYETDHWDTEGETRMAGVECACGALFDGFPSVGEAGAALARHAEDETPGSAGATSAAQPAGSGSTSPEPETPAPAADAPTSREPVGADGCGCPITVELTANGSDVDGTERVEHRAGCWNTPVTPPPGSPATWTAEQVEANKKVAETRRMRESGRRKAGTLVTTVTAEIYTVTAAVELGEHGLVTAEMVTQLREAVEHLARFVEDPA